MLGVPPPQWMLATLRARVVPRGQLDLAQQRFLIGGERRLLAHRLGVAAAIGADRRGRRAHGDTATAMACGSSAASQSRICDVADLLREMRRGGIARVARRGAFGEGESGAGPSRIPSVSSRAAASLARAPAGSALLHITAPARHAPCDGESTAWPRDARKGQTAGRFLPFHRSQRHMSTIPIERMHMLRRLGLAAAALSAGLPLATRASRRRRRRRSLFDPARATRTRAAC